MRSICKFYENGYCRKGDSCNFIHTEIHKKQRDKTDYDSKKKARDFKKNDQDYKQSTTSSSKKYELCRRFLSGECSDDQACPRIHNFSIKFKEENNQEFAIKYNTFVQDFSILEPYERKIFANASLDVMFIMDCTGSMDPWIRAAKKELNNIINFIIENNPYSKIRISFVGYRDFSDALIGRQYECFDFTEDPKQIIDFISGISASGGGDLPEDVVGGLIEALNMNWKSTAKYAVLVCDAPCHGKRYHSENISDDYPLGDPYNNILEDVVKQFATEDITLYCVEINKETKKMYEIMSDSYKQIAKKPIHVEKLGNSAGKLGFFVAFSASVTLGSVTYDRVKLYDLLEGLKRDSLSFEQIKILNSQNNNTNNLKQDYEDINLTENEKKVIEFIQRLSKFDRNEKKPENTGMEIENKEKISLNFDQLNIPEIPNPPTNWDKISPNEVNCICYTWFIVKDRNINIDWKNPLIQKSQISSKIKISSEPFARGAMRYAFYMYDFYLNQKLVGKLPISTAKDEYTVEDLGKEIETVVICQHLANDFNNRVVNIVPDTRLLLNFVHCFVYELMDEIDYKYYAVENFISGYYEKYNNNAGWVNSNLNETALIAHAFSHFSWQMTKGYLMIVDLQGVGGVLTDPQIHCVNIKKFGKGNLGYYGMMKFFLTHYCNEYCNKLQLVHPRKKMKIGLDYEFFVDNYDPPLNPYEQIYKLCDLCRSAFKLEASVVFDKKVACQETYCNSCDTKRRNSTKQAVCIDCRATFRSSEYWFKMKRTDFPVRCSACRLVTRNKLRTENSLKSDI